MKTLSIILMTIMMIATFATALVLAEDNQTTAAVNSSVQDNEQGLGLNESASNGKIAWKQMGLWFTFNQEKKVEKELELAKLRLIQAKIAAGNNNSEAMNKALDAHDKIMNRIQDKINKLESGSDVKALNDSATKLIGLERAIQVHEQRITFLSNALENANLTDAQRAKIESKISKAQNVTDKLSELNAEKKDKIKTKLMAVGNLTDKEAQKIIENHGEKAKNSKGKNVKDSENESETE